MNGLFTNLRGSIQAVKDGLLSPGASLIPATHWQSQDVTRYGEKSHMREVTNIQQTIFTSGHEDLDYYRDQIKPNLPWADDHFKERILGIPLNPGKQWANWPYAHSANRHRTEGQKFSHTYMERYWPKFAGVDDSSDVQDMDYLNENYSFQEGIRYNYGDLEDVIRLLDDQPLTRQAYLPVWFPEDTGVVHGERVPCSLGYHFLVREEHLLCFYYLRSCDFVRHYRDDLYLTVRLMLWVLEQLRLRGARMWGGIKLGSLMFNCSSMHCFVSDWERLRAEKKKDSESPST